MNDSIVDTLITIELTPIVFKKYNKVYFGFDKNQSEYLYNSLIQRDFYKLAYFNKSTDFNNIVLLYDTEILNLKEKILLKEQIMMTKDTIIQEKSQELFDKESVYKKEIKKQKRKTFLVGAGGIVIIALTFLILI
jgi:hypothetical protein